MNETHSDCLLLNAKLDQNLPSSSWGFFFCRLCELVGGDGNYAGWSKIWASLIIAHSAASTVIHLLNRNGGGETSC